MVETATPAPQSYESLRDDNDRRIAQLAERGITLPDFRIQYAIILMEHLVGPKVLAECQRQHGDWVADQLNHIEKLVQAEYDRIRLQTPNGGLPILGQR